MKISKFNKNLPHILLVILFVVSSLEAFFYFYRIYIPASFLYTKSNSFPLEIPALSQLIKPTQITSEDMSLEDAQKVFYPDKFDILKNEIYAMISKNSKFLKYSDVNYIYSGTVKDIKTTNDGNINLTLNNEAGENLKTSFSTSELQQTKVFLILVSGPSPSHTESKLESAQKGDYLIIKRSTDLLKTGNEIKTEIEIYRKVLGGK